MLFLHNLTIYALILLYAGLPFNLATLLFIPGFALFCINAVWISHVLAALCSRFRDMQQIVITLLQISLFLTPIFWTPSQLTGRTALMARINPLYHLDSCRSRSIIGP